MPRPLTRRPPAHPPATRRRLGPVGWTAAVTAAVAALSAVIVAVVPAQAASANLVNNGSAETSAHGLPQGWSKGGSGTNTRTLGYASGGAQNGKRFVRASVTRYTSGSAFWSTPSAVVAGRARYRLTDYYRANGSTRIDAAFTVGSTTVWVRLGTVPASRSWRAATFTVTAPAGASRVRFAHAISSVGYVDVDNVSLVRVAATSGPTPGAGTAPPASSSGKGLVSVTFDDGWLNQYQNAFPVLRSRGIPGTFYLISSYLGAPDYMTVAQAKQLQTAGSEIGSHTVDHADLTSLSSAQLTSELADSKRALEANFGSVTDLAYPYGSSNATVEAVAAKYYASARTTNGGLNAKGSYDRYALTIGYVFNTTSVETVKQWIAQAQAANSWLVLCYHSVADGRPDDTYTTSVADFSAHLAAVASAGIRAVTVRQGLALTS